jgi:hypothetical protein
VGDLFQAFVFFRRDAAGLALGHHGPRAHRPTAGDIPANVLAKQIETSRGVNHGDYLPSTPPTPKQQAAAVWVEAVLRGEPRPSYP